MPIGKVTVPPVFAPNQPPWTRSAPSMKMLQTALRNTFFRMRRDDNTPKNSCQAKNASLQSSQYGHSERMVEAFPVFIMLASPMRRESRKLRPNYPGRTAALLPQGLSLTSQISSHRDLSVSAFWFNWSVSGDSFEVCDPDSF